MASFSIPKLFLLLSIIYLHSITISARPCKTLFISSYSFSIRPLNPNPNFNNNPSSGFVTIVTEITEQRHQSSEIFLNSNGFSSDQEMIENSKKEKENSATVLPFGLGFSSYDFNSLRDRTKDILSVVIALLFGVGCGALTAATMYLVWSLFVTRYDYDDDFDATDDEIDVKKMGYVKISATEKPVKEVV